MQLCLAEKGFTIQTETVTNYSNRNIILHKKDPLLSLYVIIRVAFESCWRRNTDEHVRFIRSQSCYNSNLWPFLQYNLLYWSVCIDPFFASTAFPMMSWQVQAAQCRGPRNGNKEMQHTQCHSRIVCSISRGSHEIIPSIEFDIVVFCSSCRLGILFPYGCYYSGDITP